MQAGKLKHRVTVQKPIRQTNEFGEQEPEWDSVVDMRVSLEPLSANELIRAAQTEHAITHRASCRYTESITPDCRLRYDDPEKGTRYFSISSLIDVGEGRSEYQILLTETTERNAQQS